jgi:hypothetical protein
MNVKKIVILVPLIVLVVIMSGCSKHHKPNPNNNNVLSSNDEEILSLGKKIFNSGAVVTFAPNVTDLKKSRVFSFITGKEVKPCQQWDQPPESGISFQNTVNNKCEVKVVEENGRTILVKKNGERVDPDDEYNFTILRHSGSICWTFINGSQWTECYDEADVADWCTTHNHPICNLL